MGTSRRTHVRKRVWKSLGLCKGERDGVIAEDLCMN